MLIICASGKEAGTPQARSGRKKENTNWRKKQTTRWKFMVQISRAGLTIYIRVYICVCMYAMNSREFIRYKVIYGL